MCVLKRTDIIPVVGGDFVLKHTDVIHVVGRASHLHIKI